MFAHVRLKEAVVYLVTWKMAPLIWKFVIVYSVFTAPFDPDSFESFYITCKNYTTCFPFHCPKTFERGSYRPMALKNATLHYYKVAFIKYIYVVYLCRNLILHFCKNFMEIEKCCFPNSGWTSLWNGCSIQI